MAKTIPIALQSAYNERTTTRCLLLRIKPRDSAAFGFTSTNRAVTFNDGDGSLVYQVMSGFESSATVATADTSVDNAEATILLLPGTPISEAQIIAGELDGASYTVYDVDYTDTALGSRVVSHGYLGKPRIGKGGATLKAELRTLTDLLRQMPWEKWQIMCRVKRFGSQAGEERFPCMKNIASELVSAVAVTAVGAETDRTFTASSLTQAADYFAPGVGEWTTGDNAGFEFEVESFAGGVISTRFAMPYPVTVADTFSIRRDCTRNWSGHNSCDTFANRANYRGEPKIKPAEEMNALVPGASVPPGGGGETYQPATEEA